MDKKQISKTRALAVSTIDIITNIKRHFLSVIFIMMRKTLTGLVLTALFTTTCADVVHAGRKNHWGQDNGTYIQMKRMDQDGRYNPQNLEKVQTELRFVQSNPECCHRAFSGNVGRVAKTILCLAAVGIVAGGSYGLVQALKSQDSSPSDDPFMGRNETHTSGTDLATTASPPLFTAAPTTLNPLQGQLSEALRANGQFRSELTGLRSENRRFQNSLEKFRKQLEANNKFHGRQRVQKEEQLLAKISELEAKQKASDEKIRSTEQRLQSSENRVRELERQRQQQEARQRAENERQRQQECVQRVAREEGRNPQDLESSVRRVHGMPEDQRGPICSDRPIQRAAKECYHVSCPTSGNRVVIPVNPQTGLVHTSNFVESSNTQETLKNFAKENRISSGERWVEGALKTIPNMSQQKVDEYWYIPEFREAAGLLGRQYTGITPRLSPGIEPLLPHPEHSNFRINLEFSDGLAERHPDFERVVTNVARKWEEIITGVHGKPSHTITLKVEATRPKSETHIASAGPDRENGVIVESGIVDFREDWLAFVEQFERSVAATFGHEFTHMFAGSFLESNVAFMQRFDAPGQCHSGDLRNSCFVLRGKGFKATQAFETMMRENGLWYDTFYPANDPRRNTRGVPFGNHGHTDLMRDIFKGFCDSHGNAWSCPEGACINEVMLGWLEDLGYQVDYTAAAKHRVCEHR
jgi:flagellar biosynthesis GTPase FlhF